MTSMADNSSSLSLLTVLKPGGSSHIGAESKPAKTIEQMIALMSDRGLAITDETKDIKDIKSYKIASDKYAGKPIKASYGEIV
ncbi:hypothetical protein [Bifidobacterium sp. UBA6881]|uniref:hypothetical protein n=1 Tax=Bifidobacterium sp. UBA6881 TaxID=1946109 RepID=UPI0025B8CC30|nr:hypothetical protein [Bifidobacterium sp. UBA6881]